MTKAEQKRLEKAAKEATAEKLVDEFEDATAREIRYEIASNCLPIGKQYEAASDSLANEHFKANILRAELLRRLGGAS